MTIRVLVVDDQPLIRAGFHKMVEARPDLEVVGEAADGGAAIEQAARLVPDVVLMDVRMPVMDGLEATRRLLTPGASVRAVPDRLELTVHNGAPIGDAPAGPGQGHGLVGMRERAELLGGDLSAGPDGRGGYLVEITLPYAAEGPAE